MTDDLTPLPPYEEWPAAMKEAWSVCGTGQVPPRSLDLELVRAAFKLGQQVEQLTIRGSSGYARGGVTLANGEAPPEGSNVVDCSGWGYWLGWQKRVNEAYDNGESSQLADWVLALRVEKILPDDVECTPTAVAEYVKKLQGALADPRQVLKAALDLKLIELTEGERRRVHIDPE